MNCICRTCSKTYNNQASRADYRGYCSQLCVRNKARSLGWRSEGLRWNLRLYAVLERNDEIGDVPKEKQSA